MIVDFPLSSKYIVGQQTEISSATAGQEAAGNFDLYQEEHDHTVTDETAVDIGSGENQ